MTEKILNDNGNAIVNSFTLHEAAGELPQQLARIDLYGTFKGLNGSIVLSRNEIDIFIKELHGIKMKMK